MTRDPGPGKRPAPKVDTHWPQHLLHLTVTLFLCPFEGGRADRGMRSHLALGIWRKAKKI